MNREMKTKYYKGRVEEEMKEEQEEAARLGEFVANTQQTGDPLGSFQFVGLTVVAGQERGWVHSIVGRTATRQTTDRPK